MAGKPTRFSGGHVIVVAAGDPRIAAVISQAPYTDSVPVIPYAHFAIYSDPQVKAD